MEPNAFAWLLRLRWGAILGQAVLVLGAVYGASATLPLPPIGAVLLVELVSNVGAELYRRKRATPSEPATAALLAFDVLMFTALLALSGGPSNPFSFLYLVHIALAAVMLRPRWSWALAALSLASFGSLFFLPVSEDPHAAHRFESHLQGMWVAFGVAAAFIVYFVQRVARALAAREKELSALRLAHARRERLASLATLAAGAAHELSTPLSTIAVVAKELERHAGQDAAWADDARLIREQVERCRHILSQMSTDAGESAGEAPAQVAAADLVDRALSALAEKERVRVSVEGAFDLWVPPHATEQALRAVVKNALEASGPPAPVEVRASASAVGARFEVRDVGPGMSPEVLERAGEPFFTTKGPGEGMGLGLFLTRAVVEKLGGSLRVDSRPGEGTLAELLLPPAAIRHTEAKGPSPL